MVRNHQYMLATVTKHKRVIKTRLTIMHILDLLA